MLNGKIPRDFWILIIKEWDVNIKIPSALQGLLRPYKEFDFSLPVHAAYVLSQC